MEYIRSFMPSVCRHCVLFAAGLLALQATPAVAATSTATMPVSATVPTSCTLSLGTGLAFGTLPATLSVAQADVTGTLSANCLNGTAYTVIADNGLNNSSGQRRMQVGATGVYMNYDIYSDSNHGTAFPTTIGAATGATGNGSNQTVSVYGRIPAQSVTSVGSFSDTLTFTITY